MRHVVRATLRAGADWIKLATTGGLVSEHDEPLVPEFTLEEIEVAVFEAARKGKSVAAHAYGGEGLSNAVEGGVRSIEHGGFLTEEQAAAMAKAGCFLVPTLSAMRDCVRWAETGALTPRQCEKILALGLDIGECVRVAKEYGVPLASGTDYISREQHGKNLEELTLMRAGGALAGGDAARRDRGRRRALRRRRPSTAGSRRATSSTRSSSTRTRATSRSSSSPARSPASSRAGAAAVPHPRLAEPVGAEA